MTVSTISTTLAKEIVLGNGTYATVLTVTSTGGIAAPAPNTSFQGAAAIYANVIGGSIDNIGIIAGAIPVTDSYTAPAILSTNSLNLTNTGVITGQSGVYLLNGGTVTNSGSIAGLESLGSSGYGIQLVNAALQNSGAVYGARYGVGGANASLVDNTGSISGVTAGVTMLATVTAGSGTLINTGNISGGASGVTAVSAMITNSGTITGQSYGIRTAWGGSVTNTGLISGAVDGVLLLNQQYQAKYGTSFTNSGTVEGGYFAVALNFTTGTNAASGSIIGTTFGAGVGDAGYLFNAGSIYGVAGALLIESGGRAVNAASVSGNRIGVELFEASIFTNASSAYIYALATAAVNQAAYLVNAGSMHGGLYGLEIFSGGIAVNSGTISAQREGVYLSTLNATSSPDFLGNTGYIYGLALGLNIRDGTAENYGTINAQQIAVTLVTGTSFDNLGGVYGGRYGVQLLGGTAVNSGSIGGGINGVVLSHGYFTNAGTVTGVKNAVYGTSLALTVDPGAVFNGNVTDKTKSSTLNLAGATPGTLGGLGTQFNGFSIINFRAGAHWLISGTTIGLATHQAINGFEQGDTIIVTGFSAASESFVANRGLELFAGTLVETLAITGSFTTANFSVTSSGTVTTILLQPNAPCFVAGTRILTPRGEVAVENLRIGDSVITQNGEDRPIIWLGHRTIDLTRHPRPAEVQPICIAANALAENVPRRDLWLSPDHALLIDDHLIPAQSLLNDLNIYRGARHQVTYYHLELPQHDIIFAENAATESYLETGNRNAFQKAAEITLHPNFSRLLRREKSCAPLLFEGGKLEEIRRRCLARIPLDRRRSNE